MAKHRLRLEQEAIEDLEYGVHYYRDRAGEEVALRFVGAIEDAFALLIEQPEAGRRYETAPTPRLREVRAWSLGAFPYLIFYELVESVVLILGVVEAHQDLPEVFRKRWGVEP